MGWYPDFLYSGCMSAVASKIRLRSLTVGSSWMVFIIHKPTPIPLYRGSMITSHRYAKVAESVIRRAIPENSSVGESKEKVHELRAAFSTLDFEMPLHHSAVRKYV